MKTDQTLVTGDKALDGSITSRGLRDRMQKFILKPWPEKVKSVKYIWLKWLPSVPLPVKLPFGVWWLAENDFCGVAIILGGFENAEVEFVGGFLRPGVIVVDIGAHHGFYTLIASKKVGPDGRVLAFEPSGRERKKLVRHLRLNQCTNVKIWDCALGRAEGTADLFVVACTETGCNSLRPPNTSHPTTSVPVKVETLDKCLSREGVEHVDFIKMDVEGAEIEVLNGATRLLDRRPRPVLMCEVYDIRTAPWGYPARAIVDFLSQRGFRWFSLTDDHKLRLVASESTEFAGNYVAVPEERIADAAVEG